jgi:hypothetical protein
MDSGLSLRELRNDQWVSAALADQQAMRSMFTTQIEIGSRDHRVSEGRSTEHDHFQ